MPGPRANMKLPIRIILSLVIVIAGLIAVLIAFVYLWPLQTKSLQTPNPQKLSYPQSIGLAQALRTQDIREGVKPGCLTTLYTHGYKSAQSVVMFHGVGSCPHQMEGLAQYFYARGYNVLVVRLPDHGLPNNKLHGKATAQQYIALTNEAVNIAGGLGRETGAIGLSGGGVLTTWAAEYRPDTIRRILVLSPFYAPSTIQAPIWQRRVLNVVYGYGLLPDQFSASGLSYHALGQFGRIVANLTSRPTNPNLISVASVVAPGDTAIDHGLGESIPKQLAATNHAIFHFYSPPASWNLGHDIVTAGYNPDLNGHANDVYPIYLKLYEGQSP